MEKQGKKLYTEGITQVIAQRKVKGAIIKQSDCARNKLARFLVSLYVRPGNLNFVSTLSSEVFEQSYFMLRV